MFTGTLQEGRYYKTRDGLKVKIVFISIDPADTRPALGVRNLDGDPGTIWYSLDGQSNNQGVSYAIHSEWVDPDYRWFNVYNNQTTSPFLETRLRADIEALTGRIAVVKIDILSGECKNEPLH